VGDIHSGGGYVGQRLFAKSLFFLKKPKTVAINTETKRNVHFIHNIHYFSITIGHENGEVSKI
jgi:hypothetical protein